MLGSLFGDMDYYYYYY